MLNDMVEFQDLTQNPSNLDEKAIQLHTHNPDFYQFALQDLQKRVDDVIAKHQGSFSSAFDQARYPNTKKAFDQLTASIEIIEDNKDTSLGMLLYLLNDVVNKAEQDVNQSVISKVSSYLLLALTEYSPYHPFISDLKEILEDYPSNFEFLRKWEITHQAWEIEQQSQANMSKGIIPFEQPESSFVNSTSLSLEAVQSLLDEKDKEIEKLGAELQRLRELLEIKENNVSEKPKNEINEDKKNKQKKIALKYLGKIRVNIIDMLLSFYTDENKDRAFIDSLIFDLCKSDKPVNEILNSNIKTILGFSASKSIKNSLENLLKSKTLGTKPPIFDSEQYMLAVHYLYKEANYFPPNKDALNYFMAEGKRIHDRNKSKTQQNTI